MREKALLNEQAYKHAKADDFIGEQAKAPRISQSVIPSTIGSRCGCSN